jgi:adenylate cyclase class 2
MKAGVTTIEIKARAHDHDRLRSVLFAHHADFKGTDRQIDTYFDAPRGRLKLREGVIERFLIYYDRNDQPEPKQSDVLLAAAQEPGALKLILSRLFDILAVVDKEREIYFIENVKFHLDRVTGLGTFLEIEAIDRNGTRTVDELRAQCNHYMSLLGVRPEDLLMSSYSDMLRCVSSLSAGGAA